MMNWKLSAILGVMCWGLCIASSAPLAAQELVAAQGEATAHEEGAATDEGPEARGIEAKVSTKTLLQRLAEAESVGVHVNERLGGYVLQLSTRQQARQSIAEQATAQTEHDAAQRELDQVGEDYQEALRSGRSAEDVVRLERARGEAQRKMESLARARRFRYYDLIEVGADHVVLKSIEDQPVGLILPAARIVSVELVNLPAQQ
ncbi:MAG: hypothetical protein U0795_08090 [Pirellulales bacterium]